MQLTKRVKDAAATTCLKGGGTGRRAGPGERALLVPRAGQH